MLFNQTLEKLHSLRLHGMVRALQEQVEQGTASGLSFEERLGLVVDREYLLRDEKRITTRLKKAKLKQVVCVEDIDYRHHRGLDKGTMLDLCSCRWIHAKRNLIITGATGLGKTWLACALANKACREGFTSTYRRVPRLVHELAVARADGSYLKLLAQIARTDLVVLDDWGLAPLEGPAQHDILELIDDRAGLRSTLITSQLPVARWHDTIGDPSIADALLDRVLATSTTIDLKGESLRKERKDKPQE
jgi:DNA replication protein DnaC